MTESASFPGRLVMYTPGGRGGTEGWAEEKDMAQSSDIIHPNSSQLLMLGKDIISFST